MQPWKFLADPHAYIWTWLLGYGAFTGGIAGTIIADYWVIRKQKLKLHDIYIREGYYNFAAGKTNWIAIIYALVLAALVAYLWSIGAILGKGWPSDITSFVLFAGILAGTYFYISNIKGVNFAGVLALFTGCVGSLLLAKLSATLNMWTWFVGAILAFVAYWVLYTYWYGKHFPAVPPD
jgi:cytosine/uracil/thiamine/allantoin permease